MATTKTRTARRERLADAAAAWVRRAVVESVRDIDGEIVRRPAIRGRDDLGTVPVANPADGLAAARAIEQQATAVLRCYMRDARESGMGWRKIGELLELGRAAEREGISVAEAAYNVAAPPDSGWAMTYGQSFRWTCRTCGADVEDEGLQSWPTDFRRGHVKGCQRLAAEVRKLNRAWREAGE